MAIILTIAAITIPNLLKSNVAANESSPVGSVRAWVALGFEHHDPNLPAGNKSGYTIAETGAIPDRPSSLDVTLASGHLVNTMGELDAEGVSFVSLKVNLDFTTPADVWRHRRDGSIRAGLDPRESEVRDAKRETQGREAGAEACAG